MSISAAPTPAAYYHVTEETIRRDLDKLEKEGYATKTYGGAILGNSTKTDLSYTIRNKTNVDAKNQIAAIASRLIEDGDHLMLDDSSTSLYLAKKLKEKKGLTVITNSVELVVELSGVEGWTIILTGGRLKPESLALVGDQTQQSLRRYHVDKAVMSCKGIDLDPEAFLFLRSVLLSSCDLSVKHIAQSGKCKTAHRC